MFTTMFLSGENNRHRCPDAGSCNAMNRTDGRNRNRIIPAGGKDKVRNLGAEAVAGAIGSRQFPVGKANVEICVTIEVLLVNQVVLC